MLALVKARKYDWLSLYLDGFCRSVVKKVGIRLKPYFFNHVNNPMEKLKFLFVPNNIYLLNQNADGIVDKLGWRNVTDIQQFFLLELDPSADPFEENDSPEGDSEALTNVRPRTPSPDADDGRWGRQLL
jgi:hypothetical protein